MDGLGGTRIKNLGSGCTRELAHFPTAVTYAPLTVTNSDDRNNRQVLNGSEIFSPHRVSASRSIIKPCSDSVQIHHFGVKAIVLRTRARVAQSVVVPAVV